LSAALVALDPSFVNFTMSAPSTISRKRSAQVSSIAAGRV
jgi:hypothetical protein